MDTNMKKVFIFVMLLFVAKSCIADDVLLKDKKDFDEIQKVNMHNSKDKMNYLIHKLQEGKKYHFKDQKKFIEYILIGTWSTPPKAAYLFKNNNEYLAYNPYPKKESGKWKISSNGLVLNTEGKIKETKILYFALEKDKNEDRYYFDITFDVPRFYLHIDTVLAEIWEKEPPIK